nr:LysE family transporter [Rhodococcus sp. 311R]
MLGLRWCLCLPWLFIGLKAAGVAYLANLAWQTLKPGGRGLFETQDLARDSSVNLFRMGLVTNLLNPKVAMRYRGWSTSSLILSAATPRPRASRSAASRSMLAS